MTASDISSAAYVALTEAVKEVIFLRQVQDVMKPSMRIEAVDVFEDSKGAINLGVDKHANCRTTHVDTKHQLVRDACDAGKVRVVYIINSMEHQHANLFTRLLDRQELCKHTKRSVV